MLKELGAYESAIRSRQMAADVGSPNSASQKHVRLGFKASIITLFVSLVLAIGLTLVYLSFSRISSITEAAASKFIDKVAELSADRVGSQVKLIKDNLENSARSSFDPGRSDKR